jgi:hypothetical protein
MRIFQRINELKTALQNQGITLDIVTDDRVLLKPNKAYILNVEGAIEQTTYGAQRVDSRHGIMITLKYNNTDLYSVMDDYIDKVCSAMEQVYNLVRLENFAYKVLLPQKLVFLYLQFVVGWSE